jgi:hypothetical protein
VFAKISILSVYSICPVLVSHVCLPNLEATQQAIDFLCVGTGFIYDALGLSSGVIIVAS